MPALCTHHYELSFLIWIIENEIELMYDSAENLGNLCSESRIIKPFIAKK